MSATVAILGRPNVGKSTLFNVLTESKQALVKNQPGVTRDIHRGQVQWMKQHFEVIDTGGFTKQKDGFSQLIQDRIQEIIPSTACLIVVVDAKAGLCPEDTAVVRFAQKTNKPFLLVANKVDRVKDWSLAQLDFCQLGQQVYSAAFEHHRGISEILDWVISHLPDSASDTTPIIHKPILAMIGKTNVGKSSLCNRLHGLERMLVTDIPGTTTDSIDSIIEFKSKSYTLIDTAGLRRKSQRQKEGLEILASYKTKKAMDHSDIVLLLMDGLQGPSQQEARLVDQALKFHKPVILVVNKTDLGVQQKEAFRKNIRQQITKAFHFFPDIPVVFISAKTGLGLEALFVQIEELWSRLQFRIPTAHLNRFLLQIITKTPPPLAGATPVKFYYLTQTRQVPPSFIAFVHPVKGLTPSYKRFLIRKIKEHWSLHGIPLRIFALPKH